MAYSSAGRAEIFFQPDAGFEVTVSSFQLGAWPTTDRVTQVSVLSGGGSPLFESPPGITIAGSIASTFSGPWTSADGIRIQWGPDSFNVGIDNVRFSVRPTGEVGVIPLPAPFLLLASGLLALAGIGRVRGAA